MAKGIVKRNSDNPVALSTDMVASLISGIAESRASMPLVGGKPLLRLLKSGNWVFGQSDDPVQDGSEWAINPLSAMHGWICWTNYPGKQKNELLGEITTPITQKKPPLPEPVQDWPFVEMWAFDLKCVSGDDEGVEVLYKTNSVGGKRACDAFLAALTAQLQVDPSHPVAIVQLGTSSYQHAKYGETFNPVLEVTGWADMNGNRADDDGGDEGEPEEESFPTAVKAKAKAPLPPRAGAAPRRQRPAERG